MRHNIHITGRGAFAEAAELIHVYGSAAAAEARQRAGRSRDLGNVVHFCRWREVERMIFTLTSEALPPLTH